MLEKGPPFVIAPILNILHCILHYVDINSSQGVVLNGELLRIVAKHVEGVHWKESLKILKLIVTRSSSLFVPPSHGHGQESAMSHPVFSHSPSHLPAASMAQARMPSYGQPRMRELPGRTMDFSFDVMMTPVIGRKNVINPCAEKPTASTGTKGGTPKRSPSQANECSFTTGWKRPALSQSRTRGCLVNLLNACGQRVGLPKSPSDGSEAGKSDKVIFSQSSEMIERQSSMASSTEDMVEISGGEEASDTAQFTVFKDFDFLDNEESEGESMDNFNWGVKRSTLDLCDASGGGGASGSAPGARTGAEPPDAKGAIAAEELLVGPSSPRHRHLHSALSSPRHLPPASPAPDVSVSGGEGGDIQQPQPIQQPPDLLRDISSSSSEEDDEEDTRSDHSATTTSHSLPSASSALAPPP
ncbi:unnamed protein product, partial [Cyprideis torosa]